MLKILRISFTILFVTGSIAPAWAQAEKGSGYFDFGVFAFEDRDYEAAEGNLKKALEYEPDNPAYNHYLGKTYLAMKRYEDAQHYLQLAQERDPERLGLLYDIAMLNFKMGNYAIAVELFKEVARVEPDNMLANYYEGISLYKLERYQEAIDYFVIAAQKSISIKANGFYYAGLCHLKTGEYEAAVEKLEFVKTNATKASLRESAAKWLDTAQARQKALKPYLLYLKVAHQYDDNVRLDPIDEDLYADEGDYLTVVYFSGRLHLINFEKFKFGAGYSHYQTWYQDLDQFDLTAGMPNLYARYHYDKAIFGLSYVPAYYYVDGVDHSRWQKVKGDVLYKFNPTLMSRLTYGYNDKTDFNQSGRSAIANDIYLDLYYIILDKTGRLFGGAGYETNASNDLDHDYQWLKGKLGASFKLPWEFNVTLVGKYGRKGYDNVDSTFGVIRNDRKYYGSVTLARKIVYDWLVLSADYNYTKNDSNISSYKYDKNVVGLSLAARY